MNHKINLLLSLLVVCAVSVMAQPAKESENVSDKRFYIKAYGGYGVFTPGSYRVETRTTYPYTVGTSTGSVSRDTTISSLGKKGMGGGPRFGGGVGYIINNFLNIGVDVDYLKGNTLNGSKSYVLSSIAYKSLGSSSLDYHVMTIVPHVLFKARSSSNYYIYNRLGVLLSLPFELNYKSYDSTISSSSSVYTPTGSTTQTTTSSSYKTIRTATGQYKLPLSYGLNVALGAQFKIAGNLRGFVETFANFTVLNPSSYTEVSTTLTTNNTNTVVKSNTAVTSNTTVIRISNTRAVNNYNYTKDGGISSQTTYGTTPASGAVVNGSTTTYTNYYNYTIDQTQPSINRNMNAIGLNLGIAYRF